METPSKAKLTHQDVCCRDSECSGLFSHCPACRAVQIAFSQYNIAIKMEHSQGSHSIQQNNALLTYRIIGLVILWLSILQCFFIYRITNRYVIKFYLLFSLFLCFCFLFFFLYRARGCKDFVFTL